MLLLASGSQASGIDSHFAGAVGAVNREMQQMLLLWTVRCTLAGRDLNPRQRRSRGCMCYGPSVTVLVASHEYPLPAGR